MAVPRNCQSACAVVAQELFDDYFGPRSVLEVETTRQLQWLTAVVELPAHPQRPPCVATRIRPDGLCLASGGC